MFTALSYNFGDLQDKLDIFIACAPIVNLQHSPNKMMQAAAGIWNDIRIFAHLMGVYELLDPATDKALYKLCRGFYSFCEGLHDMLSLGKPEWNDEERLAVKHLRPATGAADQEVLHYAQIFKTGVFKQYDYGSDEANIKRYGSKTIPVIPLEKIAKVPIAYFCGLHDDLADPIDTKATYELIDTAFVYNQYPKMDHYSFSTGYEHDWMQDAADLLDKYALPKSEIDEPRITVEETLF